MSDEIKKKIKKELEEKINDVKGIIQNTIEENPEISMQWVIQD